MEGAGTTREANPRRDLAAFFVVALLVLAFGAWQRDLFDADEGRYGTVAWNMAESGDWVTPRLNGMPFMDKPPLVYWVQAAAYRVCGRYALVARSPTLLAGALWALFVFLFARSWSGSRRTAWLAGLLAVTSAGGMIGSRVGPQMDMPLAAAVAAALWAGWCGTGAGGWKASVGLGAAVGCGLLIKGPLVAVVPVLVACAWMLAGLQPRAVLRTMLAPLAWGVALLVAAPWYIHVEQAQPGWIRHFIEHEHFGRFGTGDHRAFHPIWFYVPVALIYMTPWTSLAWSGWGQANAGARWGRRAGGLFTWSPWSWRPYAHALPAPQEPARPGRRVTAGRLAWCWFIAAFVLYSLSTRKLLNYLLPAAAPLFVLLGAQLDLRLRSSLRLPWRLPLLLAGVFVGAGVLVIAGLWFPFRTGVLPTDLEAPRWAPVGPWLLTGGVLLGLGSLFGARLRGPRVRVAFLLAGAALGWWAVDHGLARGSHLGSSRRLAAALRAADDGRSTLVCFKRYPQGLGFYDGPTMWIAGGSRARPRQREIVVPYTRRHWGDADRIARGEARPGARLLTDADFERLWRGDLAGGPRRIVAVVRWAEIAPLDAHVLSGPYAGAGRTDLYVVTNRPAIR